MCLFCLQHSHSARRQRRCRVHFMPQAYMYSSRPDVLPPTIQSQTTRKDPVPVAASPPAQSAISSILPRRTRSPTCLPGSRSCLCCNGKGQQSFQSPPQRPLRWHSSSLNSSSNKAATLTSWPRSPTTQPPITRKSEEVAVPPPVRVRPPEGVTRVRSSMVRCPRDLQVVRRPRSWCMVNGGLIMCMFSLSLSLSYSRLCWTLFEWANLVGLCLLFDRKRQHRKPQEIHFR